MRAYPLDFPAVFIFASPLVEDIVRRNDPNPEQPAAPDFGNDVITRGHLVAKLKQAQGVIARRGAGSTSPFDQDLLNRLTVGILGQVAEFKFVPPNRHNSFFLTLVPKPPAFP